MTILFLIVTVIMWVLIAWAAKRRRGSLAEHAPINIGGGHRWIAIGGLAIPLSILTVVFVLGLNLLATFPIHGPHLHPAEPDILVVGHQWWWEVHYLNRQPDQQFTTANEIHIPTDRSVNIELQSADVMHSFWIPALHGKVDLIPGHNNFVRIQASDPGNYAGQCAEYCGAEHAHDALACGCSTRRTSTQHGSINSASRRRSQPRRKQSPGSELFLAAPCISVPPGSRYAGGGYRRSRPDPYREPADIAANVYPNNRAYLEAWVTHAQSLKPEAEMPDLTQFNGEQLRDLVAYLRQLK